MPKNRPQAPPVAVCEAWCEGAERPLTGHEAESGRCSWEVNPEDWGDRAAGEQGWSRDGLAFPQAGKRGAVLQHSPVAFGKGYSCCSRGLAPSLHPASQPSCPPRARCRDRVQEVTQLPYPVRLQLLALAQATQERFLLPAQGLPGGEEDGAPHIEPHPLGLGASWGWDVPAAAQPHGALHFFPAFHPHPQPPPGTQGLLQVVPAGGCWDL